MVDDVSFTLRQGEVLGIVGESGCGKSVTALSLLGLLPETGRIRSGHVMLDGRDLAVMSERELAGIRGSQIAMVFQEPMASLDPSFRVGAQVTETIRTHEKISRRQARERVLKLFEHVRLPDPAQVFRRYPHELSGGMAQRSLHRPGARGQAPGAHRRRAHHGARRDGAGRDSGAAAQRCRTRRACRSSWSHTTGGSLLTSATGPSSCTPGRSSSSRHCAASSTSRTTHTRSACRSAIPNAGSARRNCRLSRALCRRRAGGREPAASISGAASALRSARSSRSRWSATAQQGSEPRQVRCIHWREVEAGRSA